MKSMLYCDIENRSQLGSWLNDHGLTGAGAEIGVLAGSFSRQVLSAWKGNRFYMVDVWQRQPTDIYREDDAARDYEALYQECCATAQQDKRVSIIRKFSVDAAREIEDGSLDWVFIDANHAYGPVMADMDTWWTKIRVGGLLGLHDYVNDIVWPNWIEVKRAVDRWCSERGVVFVYSHCDSVWMIKQS